MYFIKKSLLKADCLKQNDGQELVLAKLLEGVNKAFGSYGMISELDIQTKKMSIRAIEGYHEDILDRYLKGSVYAHQENKHGPIPLSVNEEKVIVIPDVYLWKDVLNEITFFFFRKMETKSCVAIPVFKYNFNQDGSENKREVWGTVFLEKKDGEPFSNKMINILNHLSTLVSDIVQKK